MDPIWSFHFSSYESQVNPVIFIYVHPNLSPSFTWILSWSFHFLSNGSQVDPVVFVGVNSKLIFLFLVRWIISSWSFHLHGSEVDLSISHPTNPKLILLYMFIWIWSFSFAPLWHYLTPYIAFKKENPSFQVIYFVSL